MHNFLNITEPREIIYPCEVFCHEYELRIIVFQNIIDWLKNGQEAVNCTFIGHWKSCDSPDKRGMVLKLLKCWAWNYWEPWKNSQKFVGKPTGSRAHAPPSGWVLRRLGSGPPASKFWRLLVLVVWSMFNCKGRRATDWDGLRGGERKREKEERNTEEMREKRKKKIMGPCGALLVGPHF